MRRNWMPLYIPDFLADTMHLTAAETGAYLCLIMDYWLHDGLPDDDRKLAQIARLPLRLWLAMRPTIAAFFHDGWRHKRIDAELTKMVGTSIRRQEAASKAGTVSAINRANGTPTKRARRVDAALTPRAPSVHHSTQERSISLTSTSLGTARASEKPTENEEKPPDNPGNEPETLALSAVATPAGFAMEARKAVQDDTGIASGELTAIIQAKRWRP